MGRQTRINLRTRTMASLEVKDENVFRKWLCSHSTSTTHVRSHRVIFAAVAELVWWMSVHKPVPTLLFWHPPPSKVRLSCLLTATSLPWTFCCSPLSLYQGGQRRNAVMESSRNFSCHRFIFKLKYHYTSWWFPNNVLTRTVWFTRNMLINIGF